MKIKVYQLYLKSKINLFIKCSVIFNIIDFSSRKLMKAVLHEFNNILKCHFMKKVVPNIAFNVLDEWWKKASSQSKVLILSLIHI